MLLSAIDFIYARLRSVISTFLRFWDLYTSRQVGYLGSCLFKKDADGQLLTLFFKLGQLTFLKPVIFPKVGVVCKVCGCAFREILSC